MSIIRDMPWSLSITMFLVVLVAFDVSVPVTSLKHNNMVCEQYQTCVCGFPSGQGINLTNLVSNTLIVNYTKDNLVFYLNPCDDAHAPCPNGSSFCVLDEKTNQTTNLGSKSASYFSSQGIFNPVFLNYEITGLKTEINLECSDKPENTLVFNGDINDVTPGIKAYHLILRSPEACLKSVEKLRNDVNEGLSSGSVFFIIFLILVCAYLLVGAAVNHFCRGATGWEMIPNIEFWRRLPSAFMDGVRFVANGCQPPPSYEQI